jgi:hypothetical protein
MYIKITNGSIDQFPYTVGKLRRDNKNVSFPKQVSASDMAEFGMYPVTTLDLPSYNIRTEVLSQNSEPTLVSEVWTLGFTVSNKSTDELAAYDSQLAFQIREQRDALLAATDWTAMADAPTQAAEMTAYRTLLRNLPEQADFPTTITWPTAP